MAEVGGQVNGMGTNGPATAPKLPAEGWGRRVEYGPDDFGTEPSWWNGMKDQEAID